MLVRERECRLLYPLLDKEKEESARVYSFEADETGNGDQNPQQGNATQHLRMKKLSRYTTGFRKSNLLKKLPNLSSWMRMATRLRKRKLLLKRLMIRSQSGILVTLFGALQTIVCVTLHRSSKTLRGQELPWK